MYSKIIVTLDGSAYAERALPHAEALAKGLGLKLVLLQVVPYPEVQDEAIEDDRAKEDREYMGGLSEGLKSRGVDAKIEVLWGPVAQKIVEYADADEKALLVMGSHGRTGLARLAVGIVTEAVLRDVKTTPVLVCRCLSHDSK